MSVFAVLRNKHSYRQAKRRAGPDDLVCGTITPDGVPHYFVMPAAVSETDVWVHAFQIREGRPPTMLEKTMASIAQRNPSA